MPPAGEPEHTVPWGVAGAVALLFVLILAAGALFYHSQEQQITDSVSSELSSIALLKADQIAEWRSERLGDADVLSGNRLFIDGVKEYLASPDPARQQEILALFSQINTSYHYHNVQLVDPEGRVKASLDPTDSQISPELGKALAESLAGHNATLTDLTPGTDNGSPRMYAIAPLIVMENGRTDMVGAVILTIDPATDLYPLVQSWPVPSASAETLLVRREGDHVLYLNELRHQQNTALNLTIPLSRTDLPAVMAVLGTSGAFTGRDYRGIEVISALEPIRGSSWFMVAKVDREEALASWRNRSGLIVALVAGTLIGAVVIVGLFWQRRQKYLYRSLYATEAAQRKEVEKNRERLEVLLKLGGMDTAGEQELADFVLDAGCRLTDSPFAFIGVMSPDESVFDITSWSKSAMKDCSVAASPIHFPVAKAGIWAEAIRQRKPLIVNDYAASRPGKKGLPEGHVRVTRFTSVPIFDEQQIVMVCAVANKETDYTAVDVDNLALLMQGVWSHTRKRKADEALRQKTTDLEAAFEEITATDEELRANYEEIAQTQRALAESERKYRNLYHYAQVGLFETSFKDGTVVACNQQYAEMAGFASVEDAIGKDILTLYENPDDRTEVGRLLREKGFIENHTVRFRNRATGKLFWGQFSARFNYEREVAEGTIIDITVQKEAEEALRENERRLRESQAMAHLGFWYWDVKTGNVEWSDEVFRIFGLDPKTFTPHIDSILALSPWPEDHQRDRELIQKAMESREPGSYEQRFLRPDNSTGYYYSTFEGRYDEGGNLVLIVGTVLDITERKRADEALRDSEDAFRSLAENANDGFLVAGPDGMHVFANKRAADITGYTTDELVHTSIRQLVHPEEFERVVKERFRKRMAGEPAPNQYDTILIGKDGRNIPIELSSSKVMWHGKPADLVVFRDITERKKIVDSLRETNDYLQNLFDYANAPIIVWDQQFRITRFNHAFENLTGRTEKEVLGKHLEILFPEASRDVSLEHIRRAVSGERWETVEIPILHVSGQTRIVLWNSANIVDPQGALISTIAQGYDITDRKAALDALLQSEEKYRVLFTRMTEGSALHEMVYDPAGNPADYRILDVNPAFESVLGIRREDVVGKTSREAYGVASPPYLDTYARVASMGQPALFEEYFAPMGKHFAISAFSPEKGRFATIFEDITERKQAEELRERLIKELEQKNTELERFTYTVSHDLKSPLITIKGFAGLLEDDTVKKDPVQLKKDVRRIISAANTMQELLADVLELSRVGRVISPPENTPFGTIAKEAVDLLAGPLAERGIWIEVAPNLPVVSVDHARIREALINLVENAVKFMGSQQNPVIRIGVDMDGATPVFFVQDNGIGIDPRYLERIFNLFERLDVSTPGTGIGLPIVRRIIETHGGRIWAESEGGGKGTTFKFTLPGGTAGGDDLS